MRAAGENPGPSVANGRPPDPFPQTIRDQKVESVRILVIVASILKTRCHRGLSWLCQTVYWPG